MFAACVHKLILDLTLIVQSSCVKEAEVSPECSRDGMFQLKTTKAAEVQREAVVVARGRD